MELSTVLKCDRWQYSPIYREARHIVFTDQPAPEGANKEAVSLVAEGGFFHMGEGDTIFSPPSAENRR
jgi:hypothetical protein